MYELLSLFVECKYIYIFIWFKDISNCIVLVIIFKVMLSLLFEIIVIFCCWVKEKNIVEWDDKFVIFEEVFF